MRKFLHSIYMLAGKIFCNCCLAYWEIRDRISPPKTDSVLFVAHPDDDTLFFHTFIKEHKPYVCLMTTGWSLRRVPCFFKVMRQYGVRYRAYPLDARDRRMNLLEKQVSEVLKIKPFKNIAAHNKTGEYGHEEHIRVHEAVSNVVSGSQYQCTMFCPVLREEIEKYPLPDNIADEKRAIFKKLYTTEAWLLDEEEAGTPVWVTHEKLET